MSDITTRQRVLRRGWKTLAVAWTALAVVASSGTEAAERLGWHDEQMPPGLERGQVQGEYVWETDGSIMVFVPAGEFVMGRDGGPKDEGPRHSVRLDAFYIDKYEVSWGQWKASGLAYSEKVRAHKVMPDSPDWGIHDDHPVVNVTWADTQAYGQWSGKRLPTEAEWEKAARGTDERQYPWGNEEPSFERAVWIEHVIASESTAPVTCCSEGASPYGAVNMAGNVYEWCEDVYSADFYSKSPAENPVFLGDGKYRVLRGGAFLLPKDDLSSTLRYRLFGRDRTGYIGFRQVLSQSVAADSAAASTTDSEVPTD